MDSDTSNLKVPKDNINVTVHLERGEKLNGVIFLENMPYVYEVYKKVISFIEDENMFFPLIINEGSRVDFINKDNVLMLECGPLPQEEQEDLYLGSMHIENITVLFSDGTIISGSLMTAVPDDNARLSDCLNMEGRFLKLKFDGRFFFLNKKRVQKVIYADRAS